MANPIQVILTRFHYGAKATYGHMHVNGDELPLCCTLELPWLQNKNNVSCVPIGVYPVSPYQSPTKGLVWLLKDVPDRSMIEIHIGNFPEDIRGCIAIGDSFYRDRPGVMNSRKTMAFLQSVLPPSFTLTIRDFQSQSAGPKIAYTPPQPNP